MNRLRTLFLYVLGILGFMILSFILEDGLINNMYKTIGGNVLISDNASSDIKIETLDSSASNVNGYINFKLTNNSKQTIDNQYIKIDLYNEKAQLSATKYVQITDLEPGKTKEYNVKFKGSNIRDYSVSLLSESEIPDLSNIINVFGHDVDISNIFGLDLSNISINGAKLKDIVNINSVKDVVVFGWNWSINLAKSVPWWGYAIGAGVVLWYLPSGYLFGIFP